jgi:hypothetical protein
VADAIRFYFDQHIPAAVAQGLRQRGIEVLTAQDAGRCGSPDPQQLQFALAEDRMLVTFDTDYLALAAAGAAHAGIAYCHPTKYSVGQPLSILVVLHGVFNRDEVRNHVEYL